jgi:exonuclease III
VKEMHPDLICLMETKLQSARLECLKLKLGFDYVLVVDSRGKSGGLALFWKADFQVNIQNFSWHINGTVLFYIPWFSLETNGFFMDIRKPTGKRKRGNFFSILLLLPFKLGYV